MKYLFTSVVLFSILFFQVVKAESTTPAKSGQVLCSITSPKTIGFTLVPFYKRNKTYAGNYVVENLKFIGKINPTDGRLDLQVNSLDAEGEDLKSVFEVSVLLVPGEFFRFKIIQEPTIEVFCYLMDFRH
jgi:hypothetical protein